MNSDAEKRAEEMLNKLRKLKGLAPMTPEEADTAYDAAPAEPIPRDKIRSIVESVTSGELASWEPVPELEWTDNINLDEVENDALQLYRNKGEDDEASDQAEAELRDELLSDDDEPEDTNGVDGGAEPPSTGR